MNNKLSNRILLSTALCSLTGIYSAFSQSAENAEVIDLETYTVTASRMELELGKVGSSITVLDFEDIAAYEAEMATDAIRNINGIYVRNSGGLGNSQGLSLRGLPISPLVLIDGIEVNGPATGAPFNFGNLPAIAIERIEVLRGAQSSLYGANAITGVISLHTRQAVDGEKHYAVGASYGSHNTVSAYLTAAADLDWMTYSVIANSFDTDGYSSQPESFGEEWADDDGHEVSTIHGNFGFRIADNLAANVVVHYSDAESEFDPGVPSPWSTPIADNYTTLEQMLIKAEGLLTVSDTWDITASFMYHEQDSFTNSSWGGSESEARLNKFDLLNTVQFSANYNALLGLEWEEAADGIGNHSYETQSIFTENVLDVNEALTLTAGARFDDNDTYGSETSWRTSFAYNVNDSGIRIKGSYGTGFDAPEISNLFGAWGNPDLEAESGCSYDLGIEWESQNNQWIVGVNYFDVEVEDKVEFLRSTFSYANVDWTSSGVELFAEYAPTETTSIQASYSYADAKRERADDDLILHSPEGIFSVVVDQKLLDEKLSIRLSGQHVADRESWEGPTDSFFTVDIAASYMLREDLKVWVRIDNLLDEEYQEILNYNGAPQSAAVGFNLEF